MGIGSVKLVIASRSSSEVSVPGSGSMLRDMAHFAKPDQTHIRSPIIAAAPISRLRRAEPGGRDHSIERHLAKPVVGSSPGSAGVHEAPVDYRKIEVVLMLCDFHDGAFDHNSGVHVFPKRHQQLACQRDNGRFLHTPSIALNTCPEPFRQCRIRLVPQP